MNKVYQKIASAVLSAYSENVTHSSTWTEVADSRTKNYMPSGSGFDCGTKLRWAKMRGPKGKWNGKLVFCTSFHHMDEHGVYDGWTEHIVTVKPHLVFGFTTTVSGSNRNQIKDYIGDAFEMALNTTLSRDPNETQFTAPPAAPGLDADPGVPAGK